MSSLTFSSLISGSIFRDQALTQKKPQKNRIQEVFEESGQAIELQSFNKIEINAAQETSEATLGKSPEYTELTRRIASKKASSGCLTQSQLKAKIDNIPTVNPSSVIPCRKSN